ncbi:MAG: alpha/beta hydrolase [Alphaproteobacteria bacterium]|nr:MAG: alpha/beta hydrolase [Alphaproteobacteria bacterium]
MAEKLVLFLIVHLPAFFFDLLYGFKPIRIDGQRLDTKARVLCDIDKKIAKPVKETPIEETRAGLEKVSAALGGPRPFLKSIDDLTLETEAGAIKARLYKPVNDPDLPVLLYYHGGGYIRGSIESHDRLCARLTKFGGFAVLSVEYRLAPENKFPAGIEDAIAAFRWLKSHAADHGLDGARIGVGGDSSGGCLAAVVAQATRDDEGGGPVFQMLLYPTLDGHLAADSHRLFADGFCLTYERMCDYRDTYLNNASERDDVRASPLHNPDLAGLAPALIITAGFDPLRDEAEDYAKRLQAAGVNVGLVRFPGMIHGFMSMARLLPQANRATRQAAAAFRHIIYPNPG